MYTLCTLLPFDPCPKYFVPRSVENNSHVMAYLRGRISIAILRGTSRRIRGTRTPFYLKGYCEDGAGTHLFAQKNKHLLKK